jgi:acyl-CoA synthetase (AMP-forming)/AMP-acid ligase II
VPVGIPGEICVSGYVLQKGYFSMSSVLAMINYVSSYWEDEEQTKAVMKKDEDGTLWMHSGDEGMMDEEGYLTSKYFCVPFDCLMFTTQNSRWKN